MSTTTTVYIYNGITVSGEAYGSVKYLLTNITNDNSIFTKVPFNIKRMAEFKELQNMVPTSSIVIIPDCDPYELQISIDKNIKQSIQDFIFKGGKLMTFGRSTYFVGEDYVHDSKKLNYKNLLDLIPSVSNSQLDEKQTPNVDIILDNGKTIHYKDEPISIKYNKNDLVYLGGKYKVIATYNKIPVIIKNKNVFLSCLRIDTPAVYDDWKDEINKFISNSM